MFIPGLYNTSIAFLTWFYKNSKKYNYNMIAQFESEQWWKDDDEEWWSEYNINSKLFDL